MPPPLDSLLRSRRVEDRIRAVQMLAHRDTFAETSKQSKTSRQSLLLRALSDRSNYVAALAAEALAHLDGLRDEGDALAQMVERFEHLGEDGLRRDPGCHIRAHLAFAFGRLEYGPAAGALRGGLRTVQIEPVGGVPFDTGAHLRANCALALAQIRAPDALRDIALLLFDIGTPSFSDLKYNAVEPRKAAAQALARLRDQAAIVPLAVRLAHPMGESPEVLQECMQAIVSLEDPRAIELLEPYLAHADEHLAAFAALMIAQTRAPQAPALLRGVIERLSDQPLQAAVLALTVLRTPQADDVLHDLTKHPRKAVRRAASEVLQEREAQRDAAAQTVDEKLGT